MKLEAIIPDTYVKSVYDINYLKLYESGIRYAIFDVDCTILPFDDKKVTKSLKDLFGCVRQVGMKSALYSSASYERVEPVASALNVKFIAKAKKPFYGDFSMVRSTLFDRSADPSITMMIGDSFYLDMIFAQRLGLYKVMVDNVRGGTKIKTLANDILQNSIYFCLPRDKFTYGKYYNGEIG